MSAWDPIAVVGIGCRFPGTATSPSKLWQMLQKGESAWSEIPPDRFNINSFYHPNTERQGSIPLRGAHFLHENVGAFDNSFFGMSSEEAKAVDPQQRMLLEVTVEALDNAGIDRSKLRGTDTGVWVGSFAKDYEQIVFRDLDSTPRYGATGNGTAIMSNRISYFLDIHGPSMTIDTGCSASLVAVHNACQSLRSGEINMGIAAGAGLILTPNTMMSISALNFLSPDGKCFTFDARANGYGRGEGIGVVLLKRLSDAIANNDTIRAVIRGSGVNQDGRTPGITLPNPEAQLRNIEKVYARFGLKPDQTQYVECHGTGTQAGDGRETKAVSAAFCQQRSKENPIYIGSIKTNIGHLEGSAGVAGLLKGILTIENGIIPKHINFEAPGNPAIDFEGLRIKVPVENTPWPVQGMRRASINCFGFGGTNAHVVIDDAANYLLQKGLRGHHNTTLRDDEEVAISIPGPSNDPKSGSKRQFSRFHIPEPGPSTYLFIFSAHEQKALSQMVRMHAEYLEERLREPSAIYMQDLAYTLGNRRTKMQWKTSVAASTVNELLRRLKYSHNMNFIRTPENKELRVAFIFGGQGAQWFAMGRELLRFGKFRFSITQASMYLQDHLGSSFCLLDELQKDEESSRINEPEISQPATTAIQVALVDLLDHYGVRPAAVCGHSSGEIAAAYALGAIYHEGAWELAYHRGRCVRILQSPTEPDCGRMLAVGLPASEAQTYVDKVGNKRVAVACINSPISVTLSGDEDAIMELKNMFDTDGTFNRLLVVNAAYHSHHMKKCEDMYSQSIAHIMPHEPLEPQTLRLHKAGPLECATYKMSMPRMYSSVTGKEIQWHSLRPEYWVRNMLNPVLFSKAMGQMVSGMYDDAIPDIILELSPHSSLRGPVMQILDVQKGFRDRPKYLSMLYRAKDASLTTLDALGKLWGHGCRISMSEAIMGNTKAYHPRLLVDLPNYPWNHDTVYWSESHISQLNRFQPHGRYDLVGRPTPESIPDQPRWRGFLRTSENPWIRDHQVQKTIIYPAAGMIAMVLEGAKQMAPANFLGIEISQFDIQKAMIIPTTVQGLEHALHFNKQHSKMTPEYEGAKTSMTFHFVIYSKPLDAPWQKHGSGSVTIHHPDTVTGAQLEHKSQWERQMKTDKYYQIYLETKVRCHEPVIPRHLYESLDVIGMNYGPLFQNITSLHTGGNACVGTVGVPDTKAVMPKRFEYPCIVHPTTLDSVIQTALAINGEPMIPSYLGHLYISADACALTETGHQLVTYAHAKCHRSRDTSASFIVSDNSWLGSSEPKAHPLIVVNDMRFTALTLSSKDATGGFIPRYRNLCSQIVWENVGLTQTIVEAKKAPQSLLILVPEAVNPSVDELCTELSKLRGLNCEFRTLQSIAQEETLSSFCISFLEAQGQNFIWDWSEADFVAFRSLIGAVKGILWITRGLQVEATNPKSGLFQGLARTINSEYPGKELVSLDVSSDLESTPPFKVVQNIQAVLDASFFSPESTVPKEVEYVERSGQFTIPRLAPIDEINDIIERGTAQLEPELQLMPPIQTRPLKLMVGKFGSHKGLYWDDDPKAHEPLLPGYVKVRVIMSALGELDDDVVHERVKEHSVGTGMYGIVEQVGRNVASSKAGDFVVGVVRGTLKDFVRCHHDLVYKISESQPLLSKAHLVTPLTVARYALSRLELGDTILIYNAAGSFGQAAIQIAGFMGATVIAGIKSNYQREQIHRYYGIPHEYIVDTRTPAFVDKVIRLTNGNGVDMIYDTAGMNRGIGMECVVEGGHIISFARKLSGRNTSQRDSETATKTYTSTILDISQLINNLPYKVGEALSFVCQSIASDQLRILEPAPLRFFDYSALPEAFDYLASDDSSGQVCCQRPTAKPVPIIPQPRHSVKERLRGDSTYVLSGGLGGLGIEIAKLLQANGVKYIAFLSRSGGADELAKSCVNLLQKKGVTVRIFKVDICDEQAVRMSFAAIQKCLPPVKGIFQCAASLRDSVFQNMTYEDWTIATRPKTIGSWNLFQAGPADIDFFIFLSSSTGVIGNRGQANYAAGNTFQDSLARHINMTSGGRTYAISLDFGPILGAGMLTGDTGALDKLKASGFIGIRLRDFKKVMECAISGYMGGDQHTPTQVVTGVGTGGIVRQIKVADPYWTRTALFTQLNKLDLPPDGDSSSDTDGADPSTQVAKKLAQAVSVSEARSVVSLGLRAMLARSIDMDAEDVDGSKPPSAYGVDSVVAVSVRSWVFRECKSEISIFEIQSGISIDELSRMIVENRVRPGSG
ncbi:ketoacyl-synt-domain-containing protein [Biscogniauxia sp. FL1348]|nr:ketoacyl-synt-domain-containing protein [Biscogniauxia sp. FL1348]